MLLAENDLFFATITRPHTITRPAAAVSAGTAAAGVAAGALTAEAAVADARVFCRVLPGMSDDVMQRSQYLMPGG